MAGGTVINFMAPVNEVSVNLLCMHAANAVGSLQKSVTIVMSSDGGNSEPAFTAYNYLRLLPLEITTINIGSIKSSAMIIFLAGDIRLSVPGADFLIHPASWRFEDKTIAHAQILENVDGLAFQTQRFMEIYQERTGGAASDQDILDYLTFKAKRYAFDEALKGNILTSQERPGKFGADAIHSWCGVRNV